MMGSAVLMLTAVWTQTQSHQSLLVILHLQTTGTTVLLSRRNTNSSSLSDHKLALVMHHAIWQQDLVYSLQHSRLVHSVRVACPHEQHQHLRSDVLEDVRFCRPHSIALCSSAWQSSSSGGADQARRGSWCQGQQRRLHSPAPGCRCWSV